MERWTFVGFSILLVLIPTFADNLRMMVVVYVIPRSGMIGSDVSCAQIRFVGKCVWAPAAVIKLWIGSSTSRKVETYETLSHSAISPKHNVGLCVAGRAFRAPLAPFLRVRFVCWGCPFGVSGMSVLCFVSGGAAHKTATPDTQIGHATWSHLEPLSGTSAANL